MQPPLEESQLFRYLSLLGICCEEQGDKLCAVQSKTGKNFNLLARLEDGRAFLVKQEARNAEGKARGDLAHEWQLHELFRYQPQLAPLRQIVSQAVAFDATNDVLVCQYLDHYTDLDDFYSREQGYTVRVAAMLGKTLANLHRETFERQDYRTVLHQSFPGKPPADRSKPTIANVADDLDWLTPEDLSQVSTGALKLHSLYRRYGELAEALHQLSESYTPCCLIHQDLYLNNVLLHRQWQAPDVDIEEPRLRFIDWESWAWGDPALDVGTVVASYLNLWLQSVVVSRNLDINLALQLAKTPLEQLQPSLGSFLQAYGEEFPKVLTHFPDFVSRVMGFAGLALLESLRARLYYYEPLDNSGIGLFQVAKTLLCNPDQAVAAVFGLSSAELMDPSIALPTDGDSSPKDSLASGAVGSGQSKRTPRAEAGGLFSPPEQTVNTLEDLADWAARPHHLNHLVGAIDGCVQQFPPELQQTYQHYRVRDQLHSQFFCRVPGDFTEVDSLPHQSFRGDIPRSNTYRGLNRKFYQQLRRSIQGRTYWDPDWQVQYLVSPGEWRVSKQGIVLQVRPRYHLRMPESRLQPGQRVDVRLPAHGVEPGTYGVVGQAGPVPDGVERVEIFFHILAAGALVLVQTLPAALDSLRLPFSLRVRIHPEDFPRCDGGILQIEASAYGSIRSILQQIWEQLQSRTNQTEPLLRSPVPLLTKPLAPGIGLTEVPSDGSPDFGLQRYGWLTDSLLSCWRREDQDPGTYLAAVKQSLMDQGLDPQRPYLNPNSTDSYRPLFP